MEYLSEVAMTFRKSDSKKILKMMELYDKDHQENQETAEDIYRQARRWETWDGYVILHWESIKWYDGGVDFWENLRQDRYRLETPCDFIRIGDDPKDITESNDLGAGCVYVHSCIEFA